MACRLVGVLKGAIAGAGAFRKAPNVDGMSWVRRGQTLCNIGGLEARLGELFRVDITLVGLSG